MVDDWQLAIARVKAQWRECEEHEWRSFPSGVRCVRCGMPMFWLVGAPAKESSSG